MSSNGARITQCHTCIQTVNAKYINRKQHVRIHDTLARFLLYKRQSHEHHGVLNSQRLDCSYQWSVLVTLYDRLIPLIKGQKCGKHFYVIMCKFNPYRLRYVNQFATRHWTSQGGSWWASRSASEWLHISVKTSYFTGHSTDCSNAYRGKQRSNPTIKALCRQWTVESPQIVLIH